jgi:hypothetical protein
MDALLTGGLRGGTAMAANNEVQGGSGEVLQYE